MGVGCFSCGFGRKTGRCGCATRNCLFTLGLWIELVGHLGGFSHGKGYDADRCSLGISFHGCLVVDRRREKRRQHIG